MPKGQRGLSSPTANQDSSVCYGESGGTCRLRGPQKSLIYWGALNDAEHQSLRPCYRTRQTKTLSVCFWESGGMSCPLPSGYPKVNQDFICLLLGERRHESSAGSPKIFDLLGCFSTMTRSHRSIRPHCRTRRYRTRHQLPITNYQLPITNLRLCLFAKNWGLHNKPGASFQRNGRSGIRLER